MTPYLDDGDVTVYAGDCIEVMRLLPADSIDAVITDPPYGLEFMGKEWDKFGSDTGNGYTEKPRFNTAEGFGGYKTRPNHYEAGHPFQAWCEAWAREAIRVLKPGGHLAAFGGTRTNHRLASGIEDAGFEIRDTLAWLYGSGFPKSLDVSKAIDKAAGAQREVIGQRSTIPDRPITEDWGKCAQAKQSIAFGGGEGVVVDVTAPATPDAEQWDGWGTALKPAHEPITLARKPLTGTVAANVLAFGTGALNIDACRIGTTKNVPASPRNGTDRIYGEYGAQTGNESGHDPNVGRWPANVILDTEAAAILDQQTGASRFFYTAKSSASERNDGLHDLPAVHRREGTKNSTPRSEQIYEAVGRLGAPRANTHPTVKPINLMRWLIRLLAPPGALILDPFAGSGTTGIAARRESVRCILIEKEPEYLPIIAGRLSQLSLLGGDT